jgi:hypothetical protein
MKQNLKSNDVSEIPLAQEVSLGTSDCVAISVVHSQKIWQTALSGLCKL